ncbi:MAG: TonB-dependent receptor [Ignavibacteriales bacterium]|nr:TonB-dependent receptor [Ignavibacteriales bacterium]MCF8437378.1 TonB-dependent receptor [Ignavibacteriales bacterium]
MKIITKTLLSLLILIMASGSVYGKLGTTGKIAGRVTDATTGEALPFVNIIIEGTSLGAASDIDGYFSIINIPPGTYSVKASAIGYNSSTVKNAKVSIDLTTSIDFQLSDTSIQLKEEIVVVATKPMVTKDQTASTAIVGDELIKELPVTEIGDVLALQAGIVVGSGGGIHVRGGRSGQIGYQIDGVPVTDAYDGGSVVDINTSAVKELQVISGAFNAEYGQAMSGIVNLVTKDGSNNFAGSISAYIGDYVSSNSDIFWNINSINPVAIRNVEASLSGPILKDKLFYFGNWRYFYNTGYFYGRRDFLTTDRASESPINPGEFLISGPEGNGSGDGEFVAMNPSQRIFGQGKFSFRMLPGLNLSFNSIGERRNYKDYDHNNKLTPDNNLDRFANSYTNILTMNHAVSNSSFYTLSFSYFYKEYYHYLFEDLYTGDPTKPTQYVDNRLGQTPPYSFAIGGTNYNRFERNSETFIGKVDWVTQLTQEINLQFGGEAKQHRLFYHNINLVPKRDANNQEVYPFSVDIPPLSTQDNDMYTKRPQEGAFYVQTKFEAFNLIFNAGVRFDIFNPDGQILSDPSDPNIINPIKPSNQYFDTNGNGIYEPDLGETQKTVSDRMTYWFEDAKIKTQLSPRLGLAFPISDRGVIHFSYGHFFQLPRYELLYTNPDFELGIGSGNQGIFGNADLEPQKTVKGEIGLQQQIGENMAVDLTVFFEDFRNLTGTQSDEIQVFGGERTYSRYANSDFGFSKGFIFKLSQRLTDGLAMNLDYTYSVTKGNASNPADARNAVAGGAIPETFIAPLDWDQSHTLNVSFTYTQPGNFGVSVISNFYSGQPYTPAVNRNTRVTQNAFPRNSDGKPSIYNIDVRIYKDFDIFGNNISVFMKVFNLLDLENPTGIYSETGDPFFTFAKYDAEQINPRLFNNSLDDLYTNPGFFSEPRRVELGLSYNF